MLSASINRSIDSRKDIWGPADAPHILVDLLRHRALHQPDRIAFTFLADGETEAGFFTHASLDTRARAIGAWLSSNSSPGDRALLLLPSGLDFVAGFFGCLYAGLIAVPAYPLDPARLARTFSRLQTIVDDCQPVVALTDAASLRAIEGLIPGNPSLKPLRWIAAETVADELAENWRYSRQDPGAVAVIQYTSGSTKAPRGVMVSHRNALENMEMFRVTYDYSNESTFVGWLPLAHDLGLFGHVVLPLYVGALSVLITPEAFIRSPSRWIKVMARYNRVATHAPNFAYGLAAKRSTAQELAGLDLSVLHTASLGGEPIRLETIELCTSSFERCGFRRDSFVGSYGLAEATLLVSAARDPQVLRLNPAELERNRIVQEPDRKAPARVLVSVGPPTAGQKIAIVDIHTAAECPPGHVGEVWVSGPNIALGYWNKPTDTDDTFRAYIMDTQEGPFLRTGDLGFLNNGELFITGRLKDLIILSGRNHYPQDFEFTVENCDKALRPGCTAAFSIETGTEERLVVVQELRDPNQSGLPEIIAKIKSALFRDHGVSPYAVLLVPAGVVPKTSSGKIQRQACRASYLSASLGAIHQSLDSTRTGDPMIAPRTAAEKTLAGIWSVALNLDSSAIGVHDSFFDLGGDSIAAISCIAQICDAFHLPDVPPEIFLYAPTVSQMAKELTDPEPPAARTTQILPIQPNGSGMPLVIVSPGIECRRIAGSLDPDHPVLGIRGAALAHRAVRPSVDDLAAEYVDALRNFRPQGPYALCGWCSAGVIAFEMARLLENHGEQVAFVAMLDARGIYCPPMPLPRRLFVRSWRFAQRIEHFLARVARSGPRVIHRAAASRFRAVLDTRILLDALRAWSPQPWSGRILHLWAAERPSGRFRDLEFEWGNLTPNGVLVEVPGDHLTMLHPPNVDTLAQVLAAEFDRHQSRGTR
jgi:acyl-CoA synthetase (AMP-forming)/AMP-acid ligase II/thioesterase domain-containing protein